MASGAMFKKSNSLGRGTIGKLYLVQPRQDNADKYVMRQIRLSPQVSKFRISQEIYRFEQFTKLHHPHLVHYEAAYFDTCLKHVCIVMEFCENGSLYSHVKLHSENHLPENKIIQWFTQIVAAVDYLHTKKIVHGDLRAKNIFLWPNMETCKVSDMRAIGDDGNECSDELLYGKCHISLNAAQHLPPEFWRYEGKSSREYFTAAGDMFALGCLLYFLCCRHDAFEGPDFVSVSRKISEHVYPSPPAVYCSSISYLIDNLLQVDWQKRSDSATVMKIMQVVCELKLPIIKNPQPEHSPVSSTKSLRADLRSEYGYVAVQSKSHPAEYSVDWSTLINSKFPPPMFPNLHVPMWQDLVAATGGVLPIPPILLPTELGVRSQGVPCVLVGHIQRDADELWLAGRLHDPMPDVIGPVKIRFSIFVMRKTSHGNKECKFTGEGIQIIKHMVHQSSVLVRIYGIPWEELYLKQAPRGQILIESMPEAKFWFEGLSPIFRGLTSGAYPVVDWATLKGSRKWHGEWQRMVQKGDGILYLPPLCIPFMNSSRETDELYLVSYLMREGTFLTLNAFIHPHSPPHDDKSEEEEFECKLRACISLQLDIPLKSNGIRTLKCEKTVFPLEHMHGVNGMLPRVWIFKLTKSDWEASDVTRTPRMTITLLPLPLDLSFWLMGMAPVQYETPSWLEFNWNQMDASLRWGVTWAEIISPITGPSTSARLITPSIEIAGERHVVCSLGRDGDHLVLQCKNHELRMILFMLPPILLFIEVVLELAYKNGTSIESKGSVRLINAPNEMIEECEIKLCQPEWSKLSVNQLPKLRIQIIPIPV